ncbi:MAG: methyl-accepting chemotaxis protein [Pseudomonadota bacterium]
MGIFNRFLGKEEYNSLDQQSAEVMQTLKAVNREKELATQRLAAALDAMTGAMILADEQHMVVHANAAALKLLRASEGELRTGLSGFAVDKVVGGKLESLYPSSILQRSVFDMLAAARTDSLTFGSRHVQLTASPVFDSQRKRLGTVVEWQDCTDQQRKSEAQSADLAAVHAAKDAAVTKANDEIDQQRKELERIAIAEVQLQKLVSETVAAAAAGDLTKRIDANSLHGVSAQLAGGINKLMGNIETVIDDVTTVVNEIACGRLTTKITQDYHGSFGVLKNALNATIDKLVAVVTEIQDTAIGVKAGAVEINSSNINLSSRTEQQAASLEETSAAMEEITTTVQQNAANAIQANNLARGARETAENGGQVVSRAVAAMQAISESSNKINDIIGVIDEIAFQTNLLALNAAVEAARAGDQGRGFAVVADEVRNLAGRSAKAAKEIKELIKDSGEKVKEGSLLVNKSGSTLDEIVTAVKKVNDIVAEISTASDEQATGLDEISRAVSEMDGMTQQNAVLVEQASGASKSLDNQAAALESMIAFFNTGIEARARTYTAAPVARQVTKAPVRTVARTVARTTAKTTGPVVSRAAKKPIVAAARPKKVTLPSASKQEEEDKNWAEF